MCAGYRVRRAIKVSRETREHPVTLGRQAFEKEGNLRTFVLRVKNDDASIRERTYKFNPPLVHRVLAPGEEPPAPRHRKGARASSKGKSNR